jgi:hypothetical protein
MAGRSRCGDWSKASRASLRKGVTAHGPGTDPPGRGAKERRTPGLIFRDALEQPGGKPGWLGTARARNGRTPGRDSKPGASRETSAKAPEAKNQLCFLSGAKKSKYALEAWRPLSRIIGPERMFVLQVPLLRRGWTLSSLQAHGAASALTRTAAAAAAATGTRARPASE